MNIYLIATLCFLAGVLLYSTVNLYYLKKQFPDEAQELKLISIYWTKQWVSFAVSIALLFVYLLVFPEFVGKTIYKVEFQSWFRAISAAVGLGSQWIAIALFGTVRKVVHNKFKENVKNGNYEQ